VNVRLVQAATGRELWSEVYDATLADLIGVQADIAARIADALQVELGGRPPAAAAPSTSAAAYAAYLQAMALYRAQGGIGVSLPPEARAAMRERLEAARQEDPQFAGPLGWLAHLDLDTLLFSSIGEAEWPQASAALYAQSEQGARLALSRDPSLGIAHTTLARLHMYRWELDEASAAIERGLAANPNDSMVLHYAALLHCLRDEHERAVRVARRALSVDPLNPAPHIPLILGLTALGDIDDALQAARRMIEVAPTAAIGYVALARLRSREELVAADETRRALSMTTQFVASLRNFRVDAALSHARAGQSAVAAELIDGFRRETRGRHVDPALDAMALIALGDAEAALERMTDAAAHRKEGMDPVAVMLVQRNAWSDPALETPAWRDVRRRLGFSGTR
jgi:tetratricopeptide (TPR) repeat protein